MFYLCVFALAALAPFAIALDGPHVCTKVEEYAVEVKVVTHIPYKVRTYQLCSRFPFRCSVEKIAYRLGSKMETRLQNRTVETCCKGYTEVAERCIPVCSNACIYGICVASEVCECHPGWGGPTCNTTCPIGKWGTNCEQACNCSSNAKCDPVDGRCNCLPGTYGTGCKNICTCKNGDCNSITGECACYPGWKGNHCDEACGHSTFGYYCSQNCTCNTSGTSTCRSSDGLCVCHDGYQGHDCADRCDDGYFGHKCSHKCDCELSNYRCDAVVGCKCKFELGANGSCKDNIQSSSFYHKLHDDETPGASVFVVISLIAVSLLAVAVVVIYRFKRKLNRLKSDLAYVTYVTDRGNDDFDNPVYAYQPSAGHSSQACAIVSSTFGSGSNVPSTFAGGSAKTFAPGDKKLAAYMQETERDYEVRPHPETPPPKYCETEVAMKYSKDFEHINFKTNAGAVASTADPNIYTDIEDVKKEVTEMYANKRDHYYDEIVGDKHCKVHNVIDEDDIDLNTPVPLATMDDGRSNCYENFSEHYDRPKSSKPTLEESHYDHISAARSDK